MKKKDKEKNLIILGNQRNKLHWFSRILPGMIAIAVAQKGYSFFKDFWERMLFYTETNIEISKEIINTKAYIAIINSMRGYLSGFEVAMFICLLGIAIELFYLKKKTSAYNTLARLPKRGKYMFQIYGWPILVILVLFGIRFGYVLLYMNILQQYDGCEALYRVLLENIWRILL